LTCALQSEKISFDAIFARLLQIAPIPHEIGLHWTGHVERHCRFALRIRRYGMTWTNAFALGPCAMQLLADEPVTVQPIWTGSLGLGESQVVQDGAENTLTVSVTSDGTVTLDSANAFATRAFQVIVQPANFGSGARISSVTIAAGVQDAWTSGLFDANGNDMGIQLSMGTPYTPNPSAFPAIPVASSGAQILNPAVGISVDFA